MHVDPYAHTDTRRFTHTNTHSDIHTHTYTRVRAHVDTHTQTCSHKRANTRLRIQTNLRTDVRMHTQKKNARTHTCSYTYTNPRTLAHKHTLQRNSSSYTDTRRYAHAYIATRAVRDKHWWMGKKGIKKRTGVQRKTRHRKKRWYMILSTICGVKQGRKERDTTRDASCRFPLLLSLPSGAYYLKKRRLQLPSAIFLGERDPLVLISENLGGRGRHPAWVHLHVVLPRSTDRDGLGIASDYVLPLRACSRHTQLVTVLVVVQRGYSLRVSLLLARRALGLCPRRPACVT